MPETPSSCDFKSILFSPHLKSFTLAGRHFDAFKNKTRKRFGGWGGRSQMLSSRMRDEEENGGTGGGLFEGVCLVWSYASCVSSVL